MAFSVCSHFTLIVSRFIKGGSDMSSCQSVRAALTKDAAAGCTKVETNTGRMQRWRSWPIGDFLTESLNCFSSSAPVSRCLVFSARIGTRLHTDREPNGVFLWVSPNAANTPQQKQVGHEHSPQAGGGHIKKNNREGCWVGRREGG